MKSKVIIQRGGGVKIYVACHKPENNITSDEVYVPIHVGRAISKYKEEMSQMIGDDTGVNISSKNPGYCEMTAQYWAWKNVHDVKYIGFCHYRRQFPVRFTNDNIEKYFKDGTDVLVCGPYFWRSGLSNKLFHYVSAENITIMQMVLNRLYPEDFKAYSEYSLGFTDHPYNMFICRKELFDEYAEWIFSILSECEKYIKPSPYSRERRVYGYLAEYLMPVYFRSRKYKIKGLGLNFKHTSLCALTKYIVEPILHTKQMEIDQKVLMWLDIDGIKF